MGTALALLDEHGLPELTMRRLAAALGVQPSALYWHVENKQTLLAAVADRILAAARPSPPSDADWRTATLAEVEAVRDAVLAFRDGAEVVLSTRALGLGADAAHERLRSALSPRHDSPVAGVVATALLDLVLGDAVLVQQRAHADVLGVTSSRVGLDPEHSDASADAPVDAVLLGAELMLAGLELRSTQPGRAQGGSPDRAARAEPVTLGTGMSA
ncbi:TetR family transcriptional regulator [Schumannella soli]|uniref:TetR family transcriptional regulator n=1 Tax=Schumannella soli TaxID=2590779 RepID=A0A506Y3M8_9MICO|nr:TetR family transcriptional regulator [Schumannella soli]